MALQKPKVLRGGIALAESYHRIQVVTLYMPAADPQSMTLAVAVYRDKAARDAGEDPVEVLSFGVAIPDNALGNVVQQGYLRLKALPDYSGAADV